MQNQLFIDGRFVDALDGETLPVVNPHDGSLITEVAAASHLDVDVAIAAARRAQPAWSRMAASERGRLLGRLADAIEADRENLAGLESRDTGHPIRHTRTLDVPRTAACFRYFAGMADKCEGSVIPVEAGFLNYVVRAPIGVVGQIAPWHFPLMFTGWKMGPALAAGNTVVFKPSELTPLSALRVAELVAEAGFPPGVVNIVTGDGNTAGQRLANHPDVDKIAFAGSTVTGRRIVEASRGNLKRVQLALGGKGANIVFEDADLDAAVQGAAWAIFHHHGQACIGGARLIVHDRIADAFLERFAALARSIRLGNPMDPETEMGPLISATHRHRILHCADMARSQGGRVITGGKAPDDAALANGFYVEPTLVEAQPQHRAAQEAREEVSGPFVTVTRFCHDEQALSMANDTPHGLGSGLWTRDLSRAHRFARDIRAGMCWINCCKRVHPASPFGGMGESGHGREMGFEAMRDYTEARSVWINVDAGIPPHFVR